MHFRYKIIIVFITFFTYLTWSNLFINNSFSARGRNVIGTLSIPGLGIHGPITEGTTKAALVSAAGYLTDTAYPGSNGNSALAGHRNMDGSIFADLPEARVGDLVVAKVNGQLHQYEIIKMMIVLPDGGDILDNTNFPRLTLITCSPVPKPPSRLIAVADSLGDARATIKSQKSAASPQFDTIKSPNSPITLGSYVKWMRDARNMAGLRGKDKMIPSAMNKYLNSPLIRERWLAATVFGMGNGSELGVYNRIGGYNARRCMKDCGYSDAQKVDSNLLPYVFAGTLTDIPWLEGFSIVMGNHVYGTTLGVNKTVTERDANVMLSTIMSRISPKTYSKIQTKVKGYPEKLYIDTYTITTFMRMKISYVQYTFVKHMESALHERRCANLKSVPKNV